MAVDGAKSHRDAWARRNAGCGGSRRVGTDGIPHVARQRVSRTDRAQESDGVSGESSAQTDASRFAGEHQPLLVGASSHAINNGSVSASDGAVSLRNTVGFKCV